MENKWVMDGPPAILVGSSSATHTRPWETGVHSMIAINRNHSDLVKFKPYDDDYEHVLGILKRFVEASSSMSIPRKLSTEAGRP
jgi:hypothetical protein